MHADPRPPETRLGPAWVGAMALLCALISTGCDDGGAPGVADRGAPDAAVDASDVDANRPDASDVDANRPDAAPPDAEPDAAPPDAEPDAAPPPQAVPPTVTAGGATVESGRYRLRLSVGGSGPVHVASSDRLRARIGVALPLPDAEEQPR